MLEVCAREWLRAKLTWVCFEVIRFLGKRLPVFVAQLPVFYWYLTVTIEVGTIDVVHQVYEASCVEIAFIIQSLHKPLQPLQATVGLMWPVWPQIGIVDVVTS